YRGAQLALAARMDLPGRNAGCGCRARRAGKGLGGSSFLGRDSWLGVGSSQPLLPTAPLPQPSDLGRVVPAVPRIVAQGGVEAYRLARLGMVEGAGILRLRHHTQQLYPLGVQPLQQSQRGTDVAGARVCQLCPAALVIRLDRRLLFGQRPLEADVAM